MGSLVLVRFLPQVGQEKHVKSILRGMVLNSRQEPGCLRYDLFRAAESSGRAAFYLIEAYVDAAAVQAHRDTQHYREYRRTIVSLLDEPIAATMLEALDSKQDL